MVKTVTSVLKMLPSAYGLGQYFQDLGHSFSPYGPPSRQITYMYLRAEIDFPEKTNIRELKKNITTSHRRYPQLRKKN